MSTTDPTASAPPEGVPTSNDAVSTHDTELPDPVETRTERQVELVRSVRFGPILIGAAIIGGLIGAIIALLFPVAEDANYELSQAIGRALVFGGVIGLTVGAVFSLILDRIVKRKRGLAIAEQVDVQE